LQDRKTINKRYDVVVVGGGMSGVCASIASARHGAKTALIQNRPVLGGNASSEIRMHIVGASCHGTRPDARETGILEEILLENRKINPAHSFSIFDTVLWEKAHFQDGLDLYLNTHMSEVVTVDSIVRKIIAEQLTTEKVFEIEGKIFVDTTGDGILSYLTGAEYMTGREGKDVFGEKYAPDKSDHHTMGNTLLFKAIDIGYSVPFEKPFWANVYSEDDLALRDHQEITSGYWWIELGGDELDVIADDEVIRDELLKAVYGIWNHIKNSGHHNAENFVLDWVGFLPGKRESRRIVGDYILKEQDLLEAKVFEDAVAYGGWPMDMHVVGGLKTRLEPTTFIHLDDVFTIPYRSLYSKNIKNLMIGGRAISVSHMAFGSIRVMGPCSVVGQAVGTAAALAANKGVLPRDMLKYIKELQQTLLRDDCYIPGFKNEDEKVIAKSARISCSSSIEGAECANVVNGHSRKIKNQTNCWISKEMDVDGEWISLKFDGLISPKEINIKFDCNLSKEIMPSLSHCILAEQVPGIPPELVKDYNLEFYKGNELVHEVCIRDNHLRFRIHKLEKKIECNRLKINVLSTNGDKNARIFEVRIY